MRRLHAGQLEFGGGLEFLLGAVLAEMRPGEGLMLVTPSRATALEAPGWARVSGHAASGTAEKEGSEWTVVLVRGASRRVVTDDVAVRGAPLVLEDGVFRVGDLRSGPPEVALSSAGFSPLGAIPEEGGPQFSWHLNSRAQVWAPGTAGLVDRAVADRWDASHDIPWAAAQGLSDELELATAQVMTFVAQNEHVALYLPARLLGRVNPQFLEVLLWLSSHVSDEARHVEVFTKRALIGGAGAYGLSSTERSLHSLLDEQDFTVVALLLNVLGEGTFLDLLAFIARHSPDEATATAARLAHRDELRHVRFGILHIRQRLLAEPATRSELMAAVERRAAKLETLVGLSPVVLESLTAMASGSRVSPSWQSAARAVSSMVAAMERNRQRRLRAAGFGPHEARRLSELHTPNLM